MGMLDRGPQSPRIAGSNVLSNVRSLLIDGLQPTAAVTIFDVWNGPTQRKDWISIAQTFTLVSSDANDSVGNGGATEVRISGLDANLNEVTELVTLTGTTPVNTTNLFLRLNEARISASEVDTLSDTVVSSHLGTITITATTDTHVEGVIGFDPATNVGFGTTKNSHVTIPAGFQASINDLSVVLDANKTVAGQLFTRLPNGIMVAPRSLSGIQLDLYRNFTVPPMLPAGTDIWSSAQITSGGAGGRVVVTFALELVKI